MDIKSRARKARLRKFLSLCEHAWNAVLMLTTVALAFAVGWEFFK